MANFTKISENGQIEIDWTMLLAAADITEEGIEMIKITLDTMSTEKCEIIKVDVDSTHLYVYLMDESVTKTMDEIIWGSYRVLTYDIERNKVFVNSFSSFDLKVFGYEKVKGAK